MPKETDFHGFVKNTKKAERLLTSYFSLKDQSVHRSVKPHIISAFGDIALAIGTEFVKYAQPVLCTLEQAAASPVDKVMVLSLIEKKIL